MGLSISFARGPIALSAAVFSLGVLGSSVAVVPGDESKALGERFVLALHGESDTPAGAYLASDAQVFLQGATSALSRPQFQAYLERLKRGRQELHAVSQVYTTDSGVGWLLEIENMSDTPIVNPSGVEPPPRLWMEARTADNKIARLWIHFTVEALARLHIQPDVYRAAAELQGTPVPDGWQDGTAAMLAAAQRRGDQAPGAGIESLKPALIVVAWSPTLMFVGIALLRRRCRDDKPTRVRQGQLLASLRAIRSRAQEAGPGGSSESASLAEWSRSSTRGGDLEHNRARGFGPDAPAGVNDDRPGAAARSETEADELVLQA
jgi:hypothetical protein